MLQPQRPRQVLHNCSLEIMSLALKLLMAVTPQPPMRISPQSASHTPILKSPFRSLAHASPHSRSHKICRSQPTVLQHACVLLAVAMSSMHIAFLRIHNIMSSHKTLVLVMRHFAACRQTGVNKLLSPNDNREERLLAQVLSEATAGNPISVLNAIDSFAWKREFLMVRHCTLLVLKKFLTVRLRTRLLRLMQVLSIHNRTGSTHGHARPAKSVPIISPRLKPEHIGPHQLVKGYLLL